MDLFSPEFTHSGCGCVDHLRQAGMSYDDVAKMILDDYVSKLVPKEYLHKVKVVVREEGFEPIFNSDKTHYNYPLRYVWQYYPKGQTAEGAWISSDQ